MIFVFYDDDYEDAGGIGMIDFDAIEEATEFIAERKKYRMKNGTYRIIDGNEIET